MKKNHTGNGNSEQIAAAKYLVTLIRSVLEGREAQPKPEEISMAQIFRAAKKHNLECIAYEAAKQIATEQDLSIMEKWKHQIMVCTIQSKVQQTEGGKILKILTEEGIRVLPMKGWIMKTIYPKPEYRKMVDIDILIDRKNQKKAREVLEKAGYVFEGSESEDTVDKYMKEPWTSVEIHTYMMPFRCANQKKYQDIWEKCSQQDYLYSMSWDDYYVFMIEHFSKHFSLAGCGIRFVLDIAVFLEKMGKELDRSYLEEAFADRNSTEFWHKMEQIAYQWFGKEKEADFDEKETLDIWEETILNSGTFGITEQYYENLQQKISEKYKHPWLVKPVYLLKRLFPNYHVMVSSYPMLRSLPVLLPIFYVVRLVKGVVKRRKRILAECKFLMESK